MKLKYLIILLLSSPNIFSQNASVAFESKLIDSMTIKLDSILIIGFGSTPTRIFLDDLSQHLTKDLSANDIEVNYRYVGKTSTQAQSEFDTINKNGYKAILFFIPKGSSFFEVQGELDRTTTHTSIGSFTTTIASSRIDYQQDFNFHLWISDSTLQKIWTASIVVSGDFRKSKAAKKIASKLISDFKKNKYIQ